LEKLQYYIEEEELKKNYRILDFIRNYKIKAKILYENYDPNRNSFILLICYLNGILSYILSFENYKFFFTYWKSFLKFY